TARVVVSAPGRVQFNTTVTLKEGEKGAVAVPRLALPVTVRSTRATAGKVMVVVGAAAIVGSETLALIARYSWRKAIGQCTQKAGAPPDTSVCDSGPYNDATGALVLGNVATGVGIAGVALAVGGAALWWLAPKHEIEQPTRTAIVPVVGPGEA